MGRALDKLKAAHPDGIPVKDPEGLVDRVKAAASHVDPEELEKGLEAVHDAIAAKETEEAILEFIGLGLKMGLEIIVPG